MSRSTIHDERPAELISARPGSLTVSVIVLSAGGSPYLARVLAAILRSRPRPARVRLIWSGRESVPPWISLRIDVESIDPRLFDHGSTRQLALDSCTTDLIAFVSDDAEPLNEGWLEALTSPFRDPYVAAVFGRHVARPEAAIDERVFRALRYPNASFRIGLSDVDAEQGIALPVSDANSAYRVASLRAVGGFSRPCKCGEDQIAAVGLLRAGLKVAYAGDAVVLHSHDLSLRDLFRRGVGAGALARQTSVTGRMRVGQVMLGGARRAGLMTAEAWRQEGIAGLWAVLRALSARSAGYIVGRLLSTVDTLPSRTAAIRSPRDLRPS